MNELTIAMIDPYHLIKDRLTFAINIDKNRELTAFSSNSVIADFSPVINNLEAIYGLNIPHYCRSASSG